jgi:signal transduction histidine kinase
MNKSLRWKFVFIMLLLILLLMTVVCAFLIQAVQGFFKSEFIKQMETAFSDPDMISDLYDAANAEDPVTNLGDAIGVYVGKLGVDFRTRHYYILDSTGAVLDSSSDDKNKYIEITPNILKALTGSSASTIESNKDYMDVAMPIRDDSDNVMYVVYIRDSKQTVRDLNSELITLIIEAVAVGFVISVVLSFILSKTLLQPITGMTKAAEAMAGGDFSRKLDVESEDEIGILADTFNNMARQLKMTLEEIKKSEALRREFVANVSHELRTPLTSIRSYAETLTDYHDIPKEMENDFLHVILNESDRMTKIVQDLLTLSRFDAGSDLLTIDEFSLEQSIRDVNDAIALEAKKHGHEISISVGKDLPRISGDKARIEQVLLNILTNAVKYTPDGGKIEVTGSRTGNKVCIKIKDNGIGIPEEDISRIFDRFYRVDKARSRESGGTGLGLSIAREIVVKHGGDIRIESTAGSGTTVTVVLPIEGPDHEQT